jgi:predicted RNA-binding protein with PIN domain
MAILIDGYNLLHVTGIFSDAVGPGSVEKLHLALINFLATALDPAELPQTTIVFDAKGRRAGSRRTFRSGDITVHYSARHEDADTLIAELIGQHTTPRRLVVVSSDHQVQRAARRRRAKAVDSDVWYAELLRRRRDRGHTAVQSSDAKPPAPLSESDTAWWLAQFGSEMPPELADQPAEPAGSSLAAMPQNIADVPVETEDILLKEGRDDGSVVDPFPPSYIEAIQREFLSGASEVPRPKSRTGKAAKRRPKRNP